ncbi:MAG: DUF2794 domain-containing protein [Rhizobiaceae bacterium]
MNEFSEDSEPVSSAGWSDNVVQLHPARKKKTMDFVSFDRRELDQILRVYGFKVSDGEWRDYAIDMLKDRAVFSVFRRTAEIPMFMIEKRPKMARKQGAFSIVNASGQTLKRGQELAQVLKYFERKPKLVSV